MNHLKIFENFNESKLNYFVDYVMGFYGPHTIYGYFFKDTLTRDIVEKYVYKFINKRGEAFDGDSIDREIFRDILLVVLGVSTIQEVECDITEYLTKSELEQAKILHKATKYNL